MRISTGGKKLIVGYDLGEEYSQISYSVEGKDVETLSLIAGTQEYSIPTLLYKREGVNQWFYGKEALRYAQEEQGVLVNDILQLAVDGEEVLIEGTEAVSMASLGPTGAECGVSSGGQVGWKSLRAQGEGTGWGTVEGS